MGLFPKQHREALSDAQKQFKSCDSLHCAAHEYLKIAKGEAHFSIYSKIKPWDHLAGALMVEEAGGYTALWNGKSYKPSDHSGGLIAANDKETWQAVFDAFLKKYI